jgi:hypothetical protein
VAQGPSSTALPLSASTEWLPQAIEKFFPDRPVPMPRCLQSENLVNSAGFGVIAKLLDLLSCDLNKLRMRSTSLATSAVSAEHLDPDYRWIVAGVHARIEDIDQ